MGQGMRGAVMCGEEPGPIPAPRLARCRTYLLEAMHQGALAAPLAVQRHLRQLQANDIARVHPTACVVQAVHVGARVEHKLGPGGVFLQGKGGKVADRDAAVPCRRTAQDTAGAAMGMHVANVWGDRRVPARVCASTLPRLGTGMQWVHSGWKP